MSHASETEILAPIDRFIRDQSERRFAGDVPIDLLDSLAEQGATEDSEDASNSHGDDSDGGIADGRREKVVSATWGRFRTLEQHSGYEELRALKGRLRQHQKEEDARFDRAQGRIKALSRYKDLLSGRSEGQTMAEAFPSTTTLPEGIDVQWFPTSTEDLRRGRRGEGWICLTAEESEKRGLKRAPRLTFEGDERLERVLERLHDRIEQEREKLKDARKVCRVIEFRLTVLGRYLWTLEVSGKAVSGVSVQQVPPALSGHGKAVRHACTMLNLRAMLLKEGSGSQAGSLVADMKKKEAKTHLEERFGDDFSIQAGSIINGAISVVKEALGNRDNQDFDSTFWRLLAENEDVLRRAQEASDEPPPLGESVREDR